MPGTPEDELDLRPPCGSQRHLLSPPPAPPHQPLQRGIVIQLTGTEGEWDSLEDADLVCTLDNEDDGPSVLFTKETPDYKEGRPEENSADRFSGLRAAVSRSSSGSLGDLSVLAPSFLSPHSSSATATSTRSPLASMAKSLSAEMESNEVSSLKPRPLLNLVKSISTEISRSEPEVSQSKSDSRLNLHLWKQLTQPKGRSGDSRTAPPSPSSLSPSDPKVGFFKAELEDTRRKFSEAMHEPLSIFSKIMGDETISSPKLQRATCSSNSPSYKGAYGEKSTADTVVTETHGRFSKRPECDCLSVGDMPLRSPWRAPLRLCRSAELGGKLEICANDDLIQVVELDGTERPLGLLEDVVTTQSSPPVPGMRLLCMAMVAYGYFVLPLPSYVSGLALGLAYGFMIGMVLVLLLTPRHLTHPHTRVLNQDVTHSLHGEPREPGALRGWMSEIDAYDPETYHPSLTHSVYVTLEGCRLCLDYPSSNIPHRATFDNHPHETVFVRSRCFLLANSKVFLLPPALARKRVWSRKYPICIMLTQGHNRSGQEVTEEVDDREETSDPKSLPASSTGFPVILYLFGRTGREKEEWFQHFLSASTAQCESHGIRGSRLDVYSQNGNSSSGRVQCSGASSRGSTEDIPSLLHGQDLACSVREKILLDYNTYMSHLISSEGGSTLPSPCHGADDSPTIRKKVPCEHYGNHIQPQPDWINALIGRIFWDFLREKYWSDQVAHKIQKKLSRIKLPYFMNELTLTELDMGTSMPQVISTAKPSVNHKGLWIELQMVYTGCLQMTLETKMNLCKLGKESGLEADSVSLTDTMPARLRKSVLADSDEESSSAGSSDEEESPLSELQGNLAERSPPPIAECHGGGKTGRKILRFVDKIAKSKYFQRATENEYIKKKIEEMSNTPLLLSVEVQELSGTLAVNIPPPPTDRIWYSFSVPPRLEIHVHPKLGEREVTLTHITEWIEGKLKNEFHKVFVMPNMDDIYLPLMHSGLASPPASQASPAEPAESLEKPAHKNAATCAQ